MSCTADNSRTALLPAGAGKAERDESFPVAWLLPARLRAPVRTYYAFARLADDVADSPDLDADAKLGALHDLERDLRLGAGHPLACRLAMVFRTNDIPLRRGTDLLQAFRDDARGQTCNTWEDLLAYCTRSAAPVGRFLLDLCKVESPQAVAASDALCTVLQIHNHIQDCRRDWRDLGRLYIPRTWLAEGGLAPQVLDATASPHELRQVLDRMLDRTHELMQAAEPLPRFLKGTGLAAQAAATLSLAGALQRRLRRDDPLQSHVQPSAGDWMRALVAGLAGGLRP